MQVPAVLALLWLAGTAWGETHYEALGVSRRATMDELKSSFRKLAKKLHPDKTGNDPAAQEAFIRVSEAHDVLTDPRKRRQYDQELDYGGYRSPAAQHFHQSFHQPPQRFTYRFQRGGRTFVFTQDDFGPPGRSGGGGAGAHPAGSKARLLGWLVLLQNMGLCVGLWYLVRWFTASSSPPTDDKAPTEDQARVRPDDRPKTSPSPSPPPPSRHEHPVVRRCCPHLKPFAADTLRKRGWRTCVCSPSTPDEASAWAPFDELAAKFTRDRIQFTYVSTPDWQRFFTSEFGSQRPPLLVAFTSSGTKGAALLDDGGPDADLPARLQGWVERLLDGQEPVRVLGADLPP